MWSQSERPSCDDRLQCLNSHEIRLGKCEDHLRLLYQCRRKKSLVVMQVAAAAAATPMGKPADSPHILHESAVAAATALRNPDLCHIPYEKLKDVRCSAPLDFSH
jgi:hypothetical protein